MQVITEITDPNATSDEFVSSLSANGTLVSGNYFAASGGSHGFIVDLTNTADTTIDVPLGTYGTIAGDLSADGSLLAGTYVDGKGDYHAFVETLSSSQRVVIDDPNTTIGTFGGLLSADGSTAAGYYLSQQSVAYGRVGYVYDLPNHTFTDVSDPNVTNLATQGGTTVLGIDANGGIVAGDYVGAGVSTGYVETLSTHTFTDVSAPGAVNGTFVKALSADGNLVAGYFVNSLNTKVGFVENLTTQTFTTLSPSPGADAVVNTFSGDGTKVAGNFVANSVLNNSPVQTNTGFIYDIASGLYQYIADPNAAGDGTTAGTVQTTDNGTNITALNYDGSAAAGYYDNSSGVHVGIVVTGVACYARGTRILTPLGEVAIERLSVGDLVVTASGAARPVCWLGYRRVDCARHPQPDKVWPIRVQADAFAPGQPARDLWLSPEHNIAVADVLARICVFLNGRSVAQIEQESVEYWHVELDEHDVIFADGLAAESYLDTGNRMAFTNGGAFVEAHPDFRPRHWTQTCRPPMSEGAPIFTVKARLLRRLHDVGVTTTNENDLHVLADGERITPIILGKRRFAFVVPEGRSDIRLVSRVFTPAHTVADSTDLRSLGVRVGKMQIDGLETPLSALSAEGWRDPEPGGRWTDGTARLPAHVQLIVMTLVDDGCYWREAGLGTLITSSASSSRPAPPAMDRSIR